jgi:hypothetical protein
MKAWMADSLQLEKVDCVCNLGTDDSLCSGPRLLSVLFSYWQVGCAGGFRAILIGAKRVSCPLRRSTPLVCLFGEFGP